MSSQPLAAFFTAVLLAAAAPLWPQETSVELQSKVPGAEKPAGPWAEYPVREVERPTLPPEGGGMISVLINSVSALTAFDPDGKLEDLKDTYHLLTVDFRISYGLLSRWEVFAGFPYITGEIGETSGGGAGDLYLGSRVAVVSSPAFELIVGGRASLPTGDSSYHFEMMGSEAVLQNFRTGEPGVNYYPGVEMRLHSGAWSLRTAGEWILTGAGTVDYNLVGGSSEKKEVDPGDGYRVSLGSYYQITDQWATGLFFHYETRTETTVARRGINDESSWLSVQPRLMLQLGQEFDGELGLTYAFQGTNSPAGYSFQAAFRTRF